MSPLQIQLLLIANEVSISINSAMRTEEAMAVIALLKEGLVERSDSSLVLVPTERARAYINALMSVPLPTQARTMPGME